MARLPGTPKTGGRKKGTPNKENKSLIGYLESINYNVPEIIIEKMELLNPEEQMKYLFKLLEYIYPKRKAIEINDTSDDRRLTFVEAVALLDDL